MSDAREYSPPKGGRYDVGTEKEATAFTKGHHQEDLETALAVNEKKLLRKLDFKLLPALTLLYLLSFLDRSNGKGYRDLPCNFV